MFGLSIINFFLQEIASKGIDCVLQRFSRREAFTNAYERAINRWCKNDSIAGSSAVGRYVSVERLSDALIHNNIDTQSPEVQQLVLLWEEELRKDTVTHLHLIEMYIQRVCYSQEQFSSMFSQQFGRKCEFYPLATTPKHIPRTIRTYADIDSFAEYYHHPERYQNTSLYEYLVSKPRCRSVLYSEAQCGKTTEMRHLANLLQLAGGFQVSLFELRYYLYGQLSQQCNRNAIFEPSATSRSVLLLDGLDEVRDEERTRAITEIEYIARENPHLSIVVSCRGNYKATNNIEEFDALYLNQISWSDVEEYVERECTNAKGLLASVDRGELHHLCFTPFFLSAIVEHYNNQGRLLLCKSEIYDYVIKCGLKRDKSRNATKGGIYTFEQTVMPLLERVAFVMQCTELQEIPLVECAKIGLSENDIAQCQHSSIFHKNEEAIGFVHNAFKEYLVAKTLSKLPFEQVRCLVCYEDCEIIRPQWYNTLVLYVDMLGDDTRRKTLLEWLVEREPLVVIKSDCRQLSPSFRKQLFEVIYTQYQTQNIDLDINTREDRLLMDLCQSRENILFLAQQLENIGGECNAVVRNNLRLLHHADFTLLTEEDIERVHTLLLGAIKRYNGDWGLAFFYFEPYAHRAFHTEQIISELFVVVEKREDSALINGMMDTIMVADMCDKYAEWIFDCYTKYALGSYHLRTYGIFERFRQTDNLIRGLLCISQRHHTFGTENDSAYMSIKAILTTLSDRELQAHHTENIFSAIANEAEERNGKIIAEYREFLFAKGLDSLLYNHIWDSYRDWREGFYENKLTSQLFHSDTFAALLFACATPERVCDFYNNEGVEQRDRHCVIKALGRIERLQQRYGELLECIKRVLPSGEDAINAREQEAFDILFDSDKFITEVQFVLDNTHQLQLNFINNHTFAGKPLNDSVYRFLLGFERGKRELIDKKAVAATLANTLEIRKFMFGEMAHKLLTPNRVVVLLPDERQRLISIIYDHIREREIASEELELIATLDIPLSVEHIKELLPFSHTQLHYSKSAVLFPTFLDHLLSVYPLDSVALLMTEFVENVGSVNENIADMFNGWATSLLNFGMCDISFTLIKRMFDKLTTQAECYENELLTILLHLKDYPAQAVALFEEYKHKLTAKTRLKFYLYRVGDSKYDPHFDLSEIRQYAEEQYELVDVEHSSEVLCILLATGSKKGLHEAIELLQRRPSSFNDGVVINNYDASVIEDILQLPLLGKDYEEFRQPRTLINSVISFFRKLAMNSEETLNSVIGALSSMARRENNFAYLHKEVRSISRSFHAHNAPSYGLIEAYKRYLATTSAQNGHKRYEYR